MTSPDQLCFLDLIRMSMEIAEGMVFLSMSGIVHRDLAARNVLVGSNVEMKVADFGMARDVGGVEEEYNKESEEAVPVRWTAPEALQLGTYTTSSDVWSYGVVLWEAFSMGMQPYGGLSNYEVKVLVERQERMEAPQDCPEDIYLLMKECWNVSPTDRPDFMKIFEELLEIKRLVYAPCDDYYTDEGDLSSFGVIYQSDKVFDRQAVYSQSRMSCILGTKTTEKDVDELVNPSVQSESDVDIGVKPGQSSRTSQIIELENILEYTNAGYLNHDETNNITGDTLTEKFDQ